MLAISTLPARQHWLGDRLLEPGSAPGAIEVVIVNDWTPEIDELQRRRLFVRDSGACGIP
jgi:hypothetical protein